MADEKKMPDKIRFVFEKSRHHRSFHADGAWASTTPQGEIQISFFNDLRPVPDFTVHSVDSQGSLGEEVERETQPSDITRELNVTVVMNKETIKRVIDLLGKILVNMEVEAPKAAETSQSK